MKFEIILIACVLIAMIMFMIAFFIAKRKIKELKSEIENIKFLEELYQKDYKDTVIATIVGSLETHAIKKESKNKEESKRLSTENIATQIKNSYSLSISEQEDFWKWVDSEVAKMTEEERNELQNLLIK